jgi:hypothetical protein
MATKQDPKPPTRRELVATESVTEAMRDELLAKVAEARALADEAEKLVERIDDLTAALEPGKERA